MTIFLASAIDPQPNPSAFLAWFGCLCGIYIFGQGLFLLRQKRRGGKGTACAIRDARAGSLQVNGGVEGVPSLKAPVSGKSCFYFRATVWRQEDPNLDDSWVSVAEETISKPFTLKDTTGSILVEPRGAVVTLPHDTYEEYGRTLLATHTDIPIMLEEFLARHQVDTSAALRVEESLIAQGAQLYVTGMGAANPEAQEAPPVPRSASRRPGSGDRKVAESAPTSISPQIIRLSEPRVVPAAEMTMQSRVAAALTLARGKNPDEKPVASLAAPSISVAVEPRREARPEPPQEQLAEKEEGKEKAKPGPASPAFVISRPLDGGPFSISHRTQPAVEAPSATRAMMLLLAGPILTLTSIYLLLANFGWL